jgi:hypothetical protein
MPGVPFDSKAHVVPNTAGRVVGPDSCVGEWRGLVSRLRCDVSLGTDSPCCLCSHPTLPHPTPPLA